MLISENSDEVLRRKPPPGYGAVGLYGLPVPSPGHLPHHALDPPLVRGHLGVPRRRPLAAAQPAAHDALHSLLPLGANVRRTVVDIQRAAAVALTGALERLRIR